MRNKIVIIITMFYMILHLEGWVFAGYELNQFVGPSGRVINVSGCFSTTGAVVTQGPYKLFAVGGQAVAGVLEKDDEKIQVGFIYVIKDYVLSFLESVPYLIEIKAQYDEAVDAAIRNNYPTNHNTPYFYWDEPNSKSPVVHYHCVFTDESGKELFNDNIVLEGIELEVNENGTYTVAVKAQNESGNWGNEKTFVYIYDNSGPLPVNYLQLQAWGDQYFHPLVINLEFPFTEYLDENMMNVQTMTLGKKKWDDSWEDISGAISYNNKTQALLFAPQDSLKALADYRVNFKDVYDLAGNTFSGAIYFKTYLGAAMQAEVFSSDGKVKLDIPHWGLKKDAIVTITMSDGENEEVLRANRKVELRINTRLTDSSVYRVDIYDLKFNNIESFNKEASLSFFVPDENDDGVWDGTDVRIKDVALAVLDTEKKDWKIIKDKEINIKKAPERPYERSISMPVKQAIYYRLISFLAPADNINNVIIYPNPFRPSIGHTEITFLRLPADVTIRIYNLAGEFIREFPVPDQGQIIWDGTNNHGEQVASGVYCALLKSNGAKKIYKIAIQR